MDIGDIAVVPAGTKNPYTVSICGKERAEQLRKFFNGEETPEYEFWYAPSCGGAKKLNSAEDADQEVIAFYWPERGK